MHLDGFLELGANITRCLAAECSVPPVESPIAPILSGREGRACSDQGLMYPLLKF